MNKRVITGKDTRRRHAPAFKRDLVERSLQPGASVAAIALGSGINANLLFNWRRLHVRSLALKASGAAPRLLPVVVEEARVPASCKLASVAPTRPATGVIEIDIGGARVRVRGVVDEAAVRSVLQALRALA